MTRMIYAVGKFFPMQFRIGIPHENMHECPREGEKDGYVEVVDCHGKPMRAPNWEWMYRDIAWHCYIAAQPNGKLKNNKAHAAFLKNYVLEVERLPDLPVAKSWPTEPVSKRDPLVDRYREEVAEQRRLWKEHQEKLDQLRKEAENRSRASEQKYLEEAERKNGITTAATVGRHTPTKESVEKDMKKFSGPDTGRFTGYNHLPRMQNIPAEKKRPPHTPYVRDAMGHLVSKGDQVVFVDPLSAKGIHKMTGTELSKRGPGKDNPDVLMVKLSGFEGGLFYGSSVVLLPHKWHIGETVWTDSEGSEISVKVGDAVKTRHGVTMRVIQLLPGANADETDDKKYRDPRIVCLHNNDGDVTKRQLIPKDILVVLK